jgi:hypothetical protein
VRMPNVFSRRMKGSAQSQEARHSNAKNARLSLIVRTDVRYRIGSMGINSPVKAFILSSLKRKCKT